MIQESKGERQSIKITRRKLSWLRHITRPPNDTPARQAFEEASKPIKRPRGRLPG